jgi:hypothetical protein
MVDDDSGTTLETLGDLANQFLGRLKVVVC